jgi:signal transduction histidine kinase
LINTGRDEAFRVVIVEDVTGANDRAVQVARSHKRDAVKALAGALMHRLNQPLTVIMVKAAMININIEKGAARPDEIKAALKEIMDLTMTMSEMLRKVEDARDYATEPYPGGGDILSLDC